MRRRKFLAAFIIVFAVMLTSFSFYGYQIINVPNILVGKQDSYLYIPEGATFKSLQDSVYTNKIVKDPVSFFFLARLMNFDEMIKPGRYLLHTEMSNLQALRLLRSGEQEPTSITFHNVRLVADLGEKICKNIALEPSEFDKALNSFVKNNDMGFTKKTILCMFIPNTYEVYWTISGQELVARMKHEYESFWDDARKRKAKEINLTPIQVSILASIVQAEQMVHPDERPAIAGLYMNRLRIGMKLDSDPTIVFASGDFTIKRVLNIHKEIDSPFNTYKYGGLPPGPINMPEISSIDAVLNYEKSKYLYMVAKADFSGYHTFSTNLRDHINNANQYQKALSIEQRKARMNSNNN